MGKPEATDRPRLRSLSHSFTPDFIMTGSSPELLEHEVKPRVVQLLGERGLELSPTKTHLTSIEDGFDFLGQHLRKYAGKLLIKPARKNIHAFLGHIREMVKANKQATAGHLIAQLNPVIRGWANYHRHVVSHLQQSGYSHLQESVVLGHTEAPEEVAPLGGEEIFSHAQGTTMDLRGDMRGSPGATL